MDVVPPGISSQMLLTALSITLAISLPHNSPTAPSSVSKTPYLFLVTLLAWQTSRSHFVRVLHFLDCKKTLTLDSSPHAPCPTIHNTSVLRGTQVCHHLPASWSGVSTPVFPFFILGVIHGEEPLLIPVVDSIAAWHYKRAVQILPHAGCCSNNYGGHHQDSGTNHFPKLVSSVHPGAPAVSQTILILQGQIDSLTKVVLHNWQWWNLTAENGGRCLFLQEDSVSMSISPV